MEKTLPGAQNVFKKCPRGVPRATQRLSGALFWSRMADLKRVLLANLPKNISPWRPRAAPRCPKAPQDAISGRKLEEKATSTEQKTKKNRTELRRKIGMKPSKRQATIHHTQHTTHDKRHATHGTQHAKHTSQTVSDDRGRFRRGLPLIFGTNPFRPGPGGALASETPRNATRRHETTRRDATRRHETPRDATRRLRDASRLLETPPRRDFDANFMDFDVILGSFLTSLCDASLDHRLGRSFRRVSRRKAKARNMKKC